MNDITAALACIAMDELDAALVRRKEMGELYRNELGGLSNVKLMNYKEDRTPNYQIFPVHAHNRRGFAEYMWNKGIQVNINNRRNDIYDIFGGLREDLPNTAKADQDVILLPLHLDLTEKDVSRVIDAVKNYA